MLNVLIHIESSRIASRAYAQSEAAQYSIIPHKALDAAAR
jgi:hypothetical protein